MIRKCFTINPHRTKEEILSYEEHLIKTNIYSGCEIFYPYNVSKEQYNDYIEAVKSYLKYKDFEIVCHLPYGALNNVATYKDLEETMQRLKNGIDFASQFNVTKLTYHPGNLDGSLSRAEAIKLAIKNIKELSLYAKKYNMIFMIENLIGEHELCAKLEETKYFIDNLKEENVKLIFDCAHCHVAYGGDNNAITKYIDTLGEHLEHIHVSDNHGLKDEHAPLLSGTIDYVKYFSLLKELGYKGLYSSEVLFKDYNDLINTSNSIDIIENKILGGNNE